MFGESHVLLCCTAAKPIVNGGCICFVSLWLVVVFIEDAYLQGRNQLQPFWFVCKLAIGTYKVNVGPCSVFEGRLIGLSMAVLWRSERLEQLVFRGSVASRKFCACSAYTHHCFCEWRLFGIVFLCFPLSSVWLWLKKMHEVILRDRNAYLLRIVLVEDTTEQRCGSGAGPGWLILMDWINVFNYLIHCWSIYRYSINSYSMLFSMYLDSLIFLCVFTF